MKVLLINIALRPDSPKVIFPIGLGYIATAIDNAGYEMEILDIDALRPSEEKLEQLIKSKIFDVVAMGVMVSGYQYVKEISAMVKKYSNAPIICGNTVASSVPEILLRNTGVDIAVIGEGDITIVELLRAIETEQPLESIDGISFLKDDQMVYTEPRESIKDLSDLPFIKYDLFDMDTYLAKCKFNAPEPYPIPFDEIVALPINTARGCVFKCTFCYHAFKGKKYRVRPIEHILGEIKHLQERYGANYFSFFDELTLFSLKQTERFADGILKSGLKFFWTADCRSDLFKEKDLPLLKKLHEAGCTSLGYSLESADPEILKHMDKRITVDDFIEQTKTMHKSGVIPVTSIVVGYPEETEETLRHTYRVCLEAEIYPSTGFLLPQPGTPMYDYAIEKGIITDEEDYVFHMGDRQDFYVNFTQMSREKMESIVKQELAKVSEHLKLGLSSENLIKTQHYRQKKK